MFRPGERVFEAAPPSRRLVEALSWRLVAEMVRRYPKRLRVVELHPGGGHGDCLSLVDTDPRSPIERIDLNRVGSGFVHPREDEDWVWRGIWSELAAAEDPRDGVRTLSEAAGFPDLDRLPPSTPGVVSYRVIAALVGAEAFSREPLECRNGYVDTSGYGGGVWEQMFDAFPAARERLSVSEPDDILGIAAYRFWFIRRGDNPVLALEAERGKAWDRAGREFDLMDMYRPHGRLWPVAGTVGASFLR